jgi:hypothetical protein
MLKKRGRFVAQTHQSARAKAFWFDLIHDAIETDDTSADNQQPAGVVMADTERGDRGR